MKLNWQGATRLVALLVGLVFGTGAVWKLAEWSTTVDALQAYTIVSFLPTALIAAGSLALELLVAFTLLHERLWNRWGLPLAMGFLLFTAIMLALQVVAGGGGDCGCLPFLPRSISWLAVGQNLFAVMFLAGIWGLSRELTLEPAPQSEETPTPPPDS
jgi:hypothetical protein